MGDFLDWVKNFWLEIALIAVVCGFVFFMSFLLYQATNSPTFTLRKDQWVCVATKNEVGLQPVIIGKSTILMPYNDDLCVEYKRR